MSRLLFTILVFWAVARSCWSHGSGSGRDGWWDEGPCPQQDVPCHTDPDAHCRMICWKSPTVPGNRECQYQYFKRVLCEVG